MIEKKIYYSEEQVKEAMMLYHNRTFILMDEVLQSLKQPRVEITFEQVNNKPGASYSAETIYKPVKCIML